MTDKAQATATEGWYVIAELQRGSHPLDQLLQFWVAACAKAADAVKAVEAHPGVLPNAKVEALKMATPAVMQAFALRPNEVKRYAP